MSTVKLEVGAWYEHAFAKGRFLQLVDPRVVDKTIGMWCHEKPNEDWRSEPQYLSGPYHIEPGDLVKPKPAGDKCWEEADKAEGYTEVWNSNTTRTVVAKEAPGELTVSDYYDKIKALFNEAKICLPLSCLILLEKGAKAPAHDFQVGDEVEAIPEKCKKRGLNYPDGTVVLKKVCHDETWCSGLVGKYYFDGNGNCLPKDCLKLIRRAGENEEGQKCPQCKDDTESKPHYCPKCGQEFYRGKDDPLICVDCFNREQTKGKLNPATLPSLLGGEQTWPDVKPGALLDTLPMNMHTTEDELVARDSDYQVCRMGDALGCIENIELGIVNNADRERIRKIIPDIRKKLATLEGKL